LYTKHFFDFCIALYISRCRQWCAAPYNLLRMIKTIASFVAVVVVGVIVTVPFVSAEATSPVEVWWPQDGAHVTGSQPFKAMLKDAQVQEYEMFWQVDGGQWNWMDTNYNDYPHKETSVGVDGWNWKGTGPYTVNFIARRGGTVVGERSVKIYIDSNATQQSAQQPTAQSSSVSPTTQGQTASPQVSISSAAVSVSDSALYVNPSAPAVKQAEEWKSSRPTDAALMKMMADTPTAKWLGGWSNIDKDVKQYASDAANQNKTAVFVLYNIPARDCGGYSAGGTSVDAYNAWVQSIADSVRGTQTIMILEPDALAHIDCLSQGDQVTRYNLLMRAVEVLKNAGARVYLDAGHAAWLAPEVAAERLNKAGIARADGFALNVSNFQTTSQSTDYGAKVSSLVGGKHFVIDTSRNGRGSNGEWCNPQGRALGERPTTKTNSSLVDAYLWVKLPGESDGSCNGAPGAGAWWPEYALELAKNAQ
jgi:endoglucanase